MKDFIKRNMPVFVIGLITIVIFVVIIVTAQNNPTGGPKLAEIKNTTLVSATTPVIGPKDSKVVLVEFSDFECPACKAFQPTLSALIAKYKDRVQFAYIHFPLPQHPLARPAAIAAVAAQNQGKFWEYDEKLFEISPDFSREKYIELAKELYLDVDKFTKDMDDPATAQIVDDDKALAIRLNIQATPSFILNGRLLTLTTFEDLENEIKKELTKNNISLESAMQTTQSTASADNVKKNDERTYKLAAPTSEQLAVDSKYGKLYVKYTDRGFEPRTVKAIQGQVLRITNATDKEFKFEQVTATYTDLYMLKPLKPGEFFEVRLTEEGTWSYKDAFKTAYGGAFVVADK